MDKIHDIPTISVSEAENFRGFLDNDEGEDPSTRQITTSGVENDQEPEEEVRSSLTPLCGEEGSPSHLESLDQEKPSGTKKLTETLDSNGMEDLINKILEKYGEADGQNGSTTSSAMDHSSKSNTNQLELNDDSETSHAEFSKWNQIPGSRTTVRTPDYTDYRVSNDPEDIKKVIKSQSGVAKQLISVSEGLDEVNDELEEMKRELTRVQIRAYTHQLTGELFGEEMTKDYGNEVGQDYRPRLDKTIGLNINKSNTPKGNEWIEERQGYVRIAEDGNFRGTDTQWKDPLSASYLPGPGRAHIRENDVEVTHLLTLAEPTWKTQSALDETSRPRPQRVDRFGRPISDINSENKFGLNRDGDERSSCKSSKKDGYCYMCGDFGDGNSYRRNKNSLHRDEHSCHSVVLAPRTSRQFHRPTYTHSWEEPVIYKTHSDVNTYADDVSSYAYAGDVSSYAYADDGTNYTLEDSKPAFDKTTRSYYVRPSSVSYVYSQSSEPLTTGRSHSLLHHPVQSNSGFTSRFLNKVRRRNSLGGRIGAEPSFRSLDLRSS